MVTAIETPSVYNARENVPNDSGVGVVVGTGRCPFSSAPVKARPIKLRNYCADKDSYDFLNHKTADENPCQTKTCGGSKMFPPQLFNYGGRMKPKKEVLDEAQRFLTQFYTDENKYDSPEFVKRWQQVVAEVSIRGTYELTYDELVYGAKHAWRNASRCIGRMSWQKLEVFDCRHVTTTLEMYEAMCNHLDYASNSGKLRSAITIFPQRTDPDKEFRVWNKQMLSYAGYRQPDGSIIGDPINVEFTEVCQKLGWQGQGGRFDILPFILQANGEDPDVYEVPKELCLEVEIEHPDYPWFADMGLKWYGVPGVSGMLFDCGGVEFCGAPFSGWYMVTEIAARDLCDVNRYNILEEVGRNMGLNTLADSTLWKDRAVVEVTVAVMHSFHKQNVTITDHHTAAESFMKHYEQETRTRGGCPTDWVWVVPPMGGSLTPVFHQEFSNYLLKPCYSYQVDRWKTHAWRNPALADKPRKQISFRLIAKLVKLLASLYKQALAQRTGVTILFATETGKAETFAQKLADIYSNAFRVTVSSMDHYDMSSLPTEKLLLIVASTTGNGDPPENGQKFAKIIRQMKDEKRINLRNVNYGVFALGSKAYKNFCSFGRWVDSSLEELGATRIQNVVLADELTGQDKPFRQWTAATFKDSCGKYCPTVLQSEATMAMFESDTSISQGRVRFLSRPARHSHASAGSNYSPEAYLKLHGKTVYQAIVSKNYKLHNDNNGRSTIAVELKADGSTDLDYKPGDHVAIFPTNREDLVTGVLNYFKDIQAHWDKPAQFQFYKQKRGIKGKWDDHDQLPCASVRTLLSRYLDITSPPSPDLLESLATMSKHAREAERLKELATDSNKYEEWTNRYYPHLLEVLQQFPSAAENLDSAVVIGHLPSLKPRFYSISSSSDLHYNEIHLTVAVVTYRTEYGHGNLHYGVCTDYLKNLTVGEHVTCYVRSAPSFRLPEDPSVPLVMVGPGSGIAPLRSFWQQRYIEKRKGKDNNKVGNICLFVGSQRKDFLLYDREIRNMIKEHVIQERHVALSREPGIPKTYVQHKMMEVSEDIYEYLITDGGHLYVCGDNNMADDVQSTLSRIIQREGKMDEERANSIVQQLKESKRYHEDLFGNKAPAAQPSAEQAKTPEQKDVFQKSTINNNKVRESSTKDQQKIPLITAMLPKSSKETTFTNEHSDASLHKPKQAQRSVSTRESMNGSYSPTTMNGATTFNGHISQRTSVEEELAHDHVMVINSKPTKKGLFNKRTSKVTITQNEPNSFNNGSHGTKFFRKNSNKNKKYRLSASTGDLYTASQEEQYPVSTSRIKQALAKCGMRL